MHEKQNLFKCSVTHQNNFSHFYFTKVNMNVWPNSYQLVLIKIVHLYQPLDVTIALTSLEENIKQLPES